VELLNVILNLRSGDTKTASPGKIMEELGQHDETADGEENRKIWNTLKTTGLLQNFRLGSKQS
jgi:hypothetical protein